MAFSTITLSTHAFVWKHELAPPAGQEKRLRDLRSLLTVKSRFGDRFLPVYKETSGYFGFPLYYYSDVHGLAQEVKDLRSQGTAIDFDMVPGFTLRENQRPVFDDFCTWVQNGTTGFLLEAATGWGKSLVAVNMLKKLGKTTLIIVPRDFLVRQWIKVLLENTTLTEEDIGIAQQDVCAFRGKKVVVGMIHSLAKDKYSDEFKKYFGVVVWDEVHTVGADTFSKTIDLFPSYYRFGMSATPNRKDGMQDVFRLAIAQVKLSPSKLNTLVAPKVFLRAYKTTKKHPYVSTMKDAKARRGVLISELASDLARNALIAVYVKKFLASDRRILVFSDRIEQLKFLRDILTKKHGIKLTDIGLFIGRCKESERQHIIQESKIILATYGVMAMGVDVPDLRALVFATPLSDAAQSVGRILRLCENTKDPVILDIVDVVYDDCVHWSKSRQRYYRNVAQAKMYTVAP